MDNVRLAINYLIENGHIMVENNNNYAVQSIKLAIEALEKQTSKKINNADGFGGRCPVCGYYIVKSIFSSKGHKYCSECGQKLDWEVKE